MNRWKMKAEVDLGRELKLVLSLYDERNYEQMERHVVSFPEYASSVEIIEKLRAMADALGRKK